ncbi:phage tail tape measure protein, partial [Saccharothrix sp. NRRL B-16314]|uniref:phage tail tape measure protein n=1 Tax=Saccharothrix sp. NRRL B-16314 TaxID=1463825 RepID=UPI0005241267
LAQAAQVLPKSMLADVPAVVQEYGTHFKRIGLDASTAFGMMSQFVQAGGKDIDQAGDILHEFARITSEETDRASEAYKALGLDSKKMLADIGKGGKPAADALQLTLDKLRNVPDPAKRAQLGVALFGDMAGEAADALLAMS